VPGGQSPGHVPPEGQAASLRHELLDRLLLRPPLGRDQEGRQRAEGDDAGADQDRRVHAVHERLTALVAALAGEHRGQHGDAEHSAQLADGVVGPGRDALLLRPHRRQHHVRDRCEEHRHPDARQDERDHQLGVGRVRLGDHSDPRQRHSLHRQAGADNRLRRNAIRQRSRDRCDEHRRERPRQDPQARSERRVALHRLEELRERLVETRRMPCASASTADYESGKGTHRGSSLALETELQDECGRLPTKPFYQANSAGTRPST
jgi:hypothetical protein